MDLTFRTEMGRFNYRVCAVILRQEYILAMKDERSPYYYLPGGRVHLHETAEDALRREIKEEPPSKKIPRNLRLFSREYRTYRSAEYGKLLSVRRGKAYACV